METRYEGGIVEGADGLKSRPCLFVNSCVEGLVSSTGLTKKLSSVFDSAHAPKQLSRTGTFPLNNYAVEIALRF